MRKKMTAIFLCFAMLFSGMFGCGMYDKDIKVILNNMGVIENTYTISIFKNAILGDIKTAHVIGQTEIEEDGAPVVKDVEFLGWHPDPGAEKGYYKAKGLVRYAEMEEYIYDGVLVLYAIYGVKFIEKHDLIIGWYGQSVSGLTDDIINNYYDALTTWIEDDLRIIGLDIVIRKYTGDVATSCTEILADGGADVLIGWGGNLTSLGGIPAVKRQDGINMGTKTGRYIDLIRETEKMFDTETSLSEKVWEWSVEHSDLFK